MRGFRLLPLEEPRLRRYCFPSRTRGDGEASNSEGENDQDTRNPAVVALGRLGGKKGGPASAKKLTPREARLPRGCCRALGQSLNEPDIRLTSCSRALSAAIPAACQGGYH